MRELLNAFTRAAAQTATHAAIHRQKPGPLVLLQATMVQAIQADVVATATGQRLMRVFSTAQDVGSAQAVRTAVREAWRVHGDAFVRSVEAALTR